MQPWRTNLFRIKAIYFVILWRDAGKLIHPHPRNREKANSPVNGEEIRWEGNMIQWLKSC
jgi:hypothetical protein